jgi:hypothetical protein
VKEDFVVTIARVCHEANRALCIEQEDYSQKDWDNSSNELKISAINGVKYHIDNPEASPAASHENWMRLKVVNGWVWGKTKSEVLKTHPCLVPFEKLPVEQQAKDHLFSSIVRALYPILDSK